MSVKKSLVLFCVMGLSTFAYAEPAAGSSQVAIDGSGWRADAHPEILLGGTFPNAGYIAYVTKDGQVQEWAKGPEFLSKGRAALIAKYPSVESGRFPKKLTSNSVEVKNGDQSRGFLYGLYTNGKEITGDELKNAGARL